MTADVPRRLRPSATQRTNKILTQTKGAPSAKGSTAAARPVDVKRNARVYVPPTGGFLIAAQPPASVATPDNTLESGTTYRMPRYDGDDVVFAYGQTGDLFPQVMFFGSMGQGIYFGDGTSDPASGSVNIFVESNGLVLAAGSNSLQITDDTARLFLNAPSADGKAILRGDAEASLYLTPGSTQTAPVVTVTEPSSVTPVLTVEMDGTVELHGAGVGIVMASPDGTRYRATMANGGTWSIAPA